MSGISPKVRQIVAERDLWTCVRCGVYVGPFGVFSIHHRRPRGSGGSRRPETNLPGNLLFLCGTGTTGCHGLTESQRALALAAGLLVSQYSLPAEVPVLTHRGWLLLDDDGNWSEVES